MPSAGLLIRGSDRGTTTMDDTLLEKKIRIAAGMENEGWPLDATGSTADYAALDEDLRRQAIDAVQKLLLAKTNPKPEHDGFLAYSFATEIVNTVLSKTRING